MKKQIKNPIFFIGVPRSGTTIIFEAFSTHEDLSWFSNWLWRYPNLPIVSLLSRISIFNTLRGEKRQGEMQTIFKKYLPYPSECYPVWESCCGSKFLYDFLINQKASESERNKITKIISNVIYYHGGLRFATKITGPSRIRYLESIFPDALFIHIIRDGRSVVNSLMNIDFWKKRGGYTNPWWDNGLTNEDDELLCRYNKSPLVLAAVQWRRIINIAREEAKGIPRSRYYELKYEDFMNDPHVYMIKLFDFAGLKYSQRVRAYMNNRSKFQSKNYKYIKSMSNKDIKMLNGIMSNLLTILGYVDNGIA